MAFRLPLPETLRKQGWKVKIRDREYVEPPHASILWKTECWRFNLRDCDFMDDSPDPSRVPGDLMK